MAQEKRTKLVGMQLTPTEKTRLQEMARAEGVTVSTFLFRRAFNQPDAELGRGRPRKQTQDDPIDGLQMTG